MSIKKKLYIAVLLLFIVLAIGVIGYMSISGDSFIDALYMTVITISTVGFGLVHPLSQEGKIFTIFLIFLSVTLYGYIIKVITENIASGNFFEELKHNKMQKKIDLLKGHTIICGYGRNGKQAAKKLLAHHKPFVIIERNKEIVEKEQSENIPFVLGNANEDEILSQAGIERASTLISALPNDADNLFVVLSARQINKSMCIISRASQETSYKKLKLAGANNVILPDKIGGDHMASLVVVPDLIEFIDNLAIVGETNINIEEIAVKKLYDTSTVKTIRDLDLRRKTGCTVIGYKDAQGDYVVNPEADQKLVADSKVIVLGRPEQIQILNSIYNIE